MTESTEKEMKFIEGVDLDEKNVSVEYDDVIEYEISDNASLLYSKNKNIFYVEFIDYDNDGDEYIINIEEPFEGLQIDKDAYLSKEEFEDIRKELTNEVLVGNE